MKGGDKIRITEIFYSLQGEAATVGWPTVFVRLTGCPLRCQYCDTAYAFSGGDQYQLEEVLQAVAVYQPKYVCVTGGEPLAQPACLTLLQALCDQEYHVSLETSGALPIDAVDKRVSRVMDLKTPGSGESERNLYRNIQHLTLHDQVKFVICNESDYQWACHILEQYPLLQRCEVLFSPSQMQLPASTLADWIIRDRLNVRFQVQLHKTIWGDLPGK